MGELNQHDLNSYIKRYECSYFIETGTGIGVGLGYALNFNFLNLISIEINNSLYLKAKEKFKDIRIMLLNMNSIDGLEVAISSLPNDIPILFWLDAHFPGADFQFGSYDDWHEDFIKYPLRDEINLIFKKRPTSKDVLIIDDLQLYEDGDYELKLNNNFIKKHRRPIGPILDIVSSTHAVKRDYRHQGFLILTPKE